jgi:predicted kinase
MSVERKEPNAWVMCGIPGSGKTTLAKKLSKKQNACVISGDDISDELFGNDPGQKNWNDIWNRLVELVEENCHRNLIIDGVHASESHRAETLTLLKSYGYRSVELVVLDVALETALMQNSQRTRNVEEYVIRKMHQDLQRGSETVYSEGFSKVTFRK